MKRKALAIQAALTGAALAVAYAAAARQEDSGKQGAVVLETSRGDLQLIRYEDQHGWVELRPSSLSGAFAIDARISARKGESPAPGMAPRPSPERRVRGSQHTESLFAAFAPLRAQRSLGALDKDTQARLGFDQTQRRLTVEAGGVTHKLTLALPPSGAMSPYLRRDDDGRVYVVPREFVNVFLPGATAEHRLHTFAQDEIDRIVIVAGDKRNELRVRAGDGQNNIMIFHPSKPDQGLPEAESWHSGLWTMESTETLGDGERPFEGEPVEKVRVEYFTSRGQRLGYVDLATAGMNGSEPWVFARTERSTGWLRLPSGAFGSVQAGMRLARDANGS